MSRTHLARLALTLALLTGCASGEMFAAKKSQHQEDRARKKLKDPTKLDLAYAKWQEQLLNVTEAREAYQRVIREDPQSIDALLGLARLDQLAGRTQEAEQSFRKAIKAAPNNPQALDALGQLYASQEKWPQAIDLLKQAHTLAPADSAVRFHLGVALAKSGDIASARNHFVATVGEAEADYNLGMIAHDQGRLDAAEQYFIKALTQKPALEEAQFWLTEVRTEKQSKQLLTGTTSADQANRPGMQAPAGAIPTPTVFKDTQITERQWSPQDAFNIQQTGGQLPVTSLPANATPQEPLPSGGWSSPFGANNRTAQRPASTARNPWQMLMGGGNQNSQPTSPPASATNGMTRQQIEQMQNQR